MSYWTKGSLIAAFALLPLGIPVAANAVVSHAAAAMAQTPPSVIAFNQKPKNGEVNVTYAYLDNDGYLALYGTDKNGGMSEKAFGHIALKAGDHRNFAVKLDPVPANGTKIWVTLQNDNHKSVWPKALPLQNELVIE